METENHAMRRYKSLTSMEQSSKHVLFLKKKKKTPLRHLGTT